MSLAWRTAALAGTTAGAVTDSRTTRRGSAGLPAAPGGVVRRAIDFADSGENRLLSWGDVSSRPAFAPGWRRSGPLAAPRCRREGARDGGGVPSKMGATPGGGLARSANWPTAHLGVGEGGLAGAEVDLGPRGPVAGRDGPEVVASRRSSVRRAAAPSSSAASGGRRRGERIVRDRSEPSRHEIRHLTAPDRPSSTVGVAGGSPAPVGTCGRPTPRERPHGRVSRWLPRPGSDWSAGCDALAVTSAGPWDRGSAPVVRAG